MKLRIWTLAAALLIVIAFGLALPSLLSDPAATVAVNYQQVKDDFQAEFVESFAALYHEEAGAPADGQEITSASADAEAPAVTEVATTKATNGDALVLEPTEITEGDTPMGGTGLFVKDGWINAKINQNRDKIDDADLARGAEIYNALDTDYIFGFADGGLTPEERDQVNTYLKTKLSGADYELAKGLYDKYVGLLNP